MRSTSNILFIVSIVMWLWDRPVFLFLASVIMLVVEQVWLRTMAIIEQRSKDEVK